MDERTERRDGFIGNNLCSCSSIASSSAAVSSQQASTTTTGTGVTDAQTAKTGDWLKDTLSQLIQTLSSILTKLTEIFGRTQPVPTAPASGTQPPSTGTQAPSTQAPSTQAPSAGTQAPSSGTSGGTTAPPTNNNSTTPAPTSPTNPTPPGKTLAQSLQQSLVPDAKGNVHEEQLYHSVLEHLLRKKSEEAAQSYSAAFNHHFAAGKKEGQYEPAANQALKALVTKGVLTADESKQLSGIAFKTAQLDANDKALFDNRGSAKDKTIATKPYKQAIEAAVAAFDQIEKKTISAPPRNVVDTDGKTSAKSASSSSRSAQSAASSRGFLWKPKAEKDGKLVVLLPPGLKNKVKSVAIYSSLPATASTKVAGGEGKFAGDDANGDRPHFRFSKPGASYPDGSYVVALLNDGSKIDFKIGETSERYEVK
jgi:hypothetical protein